MGYFVFWYVGEGSEYFEVEALPVISQPCLLEGGVLGSSLIDVFVELLMSY
jgi:hypothetical protein